MAGCLLALTDLTAASEIHEMPVRSGYCHQSPEVRDVQVYPAQRHDEPVDRISRIGIGKYGCERMGVPRQNGM